MKTKNKQEPKIQAIETYYKNTRFRSRLEAKWALYFDQLGMDWLYESEGYKSRGVCYLPDFYLPSQNLLFETRPIPPTIDDLRKSAIGVEASQKTLIYAWGLPAIAPEEEVAGLMYQEDFLSTERYEIPMSEARLPSAKMQFGLVGIDRMAAEAILDDKPLRKVLGFSPGGLQRTSVVGCGLCRRLFFASEAFCDGWVYTSVLLDEICPYGCRLLSEDEENLIYDYLVTAATKVRNHRFGKIA